ncbi:alpha/beta hydrolase-fold protein [Aporhodopirellula aestuarii]|uniref:Alpha/beta hydrolase-fold protein n=1 Tax=Aporhodopirellula aestuarii TaxID=2950107 RepID=A0ABT0U4Y3_9BACT|nr:alpha/beta hydrolase-fold protein [Aporhodopirellula aestuarii]MCM2371620.1 alpha/beta hydrolase-fold protein [Aporhodopirellula aestuarii]
MRPHAYLRRATFGVGAAIVVCCFNVLPVNAFEGASVVSYYGYDDCIRLQNDEVSVVLCPAAGGRVLEYALDGTNVLYLPSGGEGWRAGTDRKRPDLNAGRFDIGPEKVVKRGQVLWAGEWTGEITGDRAARLTSQFDPESGVRLIREFHLHESDSQLRCTQTIVNESKKSVSLCHWGRTFAVGGGVAVVPRSVHGRFPVGYVMYEGANSIQLQPDDPQIQVSKDAVIVTGPPQHAKLGFDSHAGWFAYLAPTNQIFVKRFETYPDRPYNEAAGLTVSVWYPEQDRVELEPIGPAENLKPGQQADFTEQWWILPYDFPEDPNDVEFNEIRRIVSRKTTPAGQEPGTLISPEVHPNRTVTFRFSGGDSEKISVLLNRKALPLTRDVDGIWKVTTGPLAPGIYEYVFEVDGVRVTDPRNRWTKKWFVCASLFEIPGEEPLLTQRAGVPHGTVHRHLYQSTTTGGQRAAVVYTPPGYEPDAAEPYPLLVLCHGFGDDETAWTEVGRAHHILDNLIAAGKISPLVVVMPNGHPIPPNERTWSEDYNNKNSEQLVDDVLDDLLPLVTTQYHVSTHPERRAITGLSMGGGHSIAMAMTRPNEFAWVGAFSAAAPEGEFATQHPEWTQDTADVNQQRRLFWIACGSDDFLLKRNHHFVEQLKTHDIDHVYVETKGNHSWNVWREYLPTFLQLLFR